MPTPGQTAKFAQLYIYYKKNEVSNRMKAIFKKKRYNRATQIPLNGFK